MYLNARWLTVKFTANTTTINWKTRYKLCGDLLQQMATVTLLKVCGSKKIHDKRYRSISVKSGCTIAVVKW